MEEEVFESRKKLLGETHSDTLNAIANLTTSYRSQGRWSDAESLGVEVLERCKEVLGRLTPIL